MNKLNDKRFKILHYIFWYEDGMGNITVYNMKEKKYYKITNSTGRQIFLNINLGVLCQEIISKMQRAFAHVDSSLIEDDTVKFLLNLKQNNIIKGI